MSWYALHVKTGAENDVENFLHYNFESNECHSIVPKRKLTEVRKGKCYEVIKIFFPGYVLINLDMSTDIYYIIRKIPNVYTVLKQDGEYYSRISDEEINPLLKLLKDSDLIDYSKIFIENSKVSVNSGPLLGLEGLIRKVDKRRGRAKVALNFMGSEKTVDLGVEILSSLEKSDYLS
ncbi:antiterminator LoaP [Acetivibrio cellulolyticus]|uniref:antiterminator LoaP n=1 Tax=Acetivibrio cellulolyticus TaxID=35830 RepID=UPI0001E300D6|nr:antiterminator LoaP [Acetivibrio cellulolyticus]